MTAARKRNRMVVDLPKEYQLAIKLQAIKSGRRTGEVVEEAIRKSCGDEIAEAEKGCAAIRKDRPAALAALFQAEEEYHRGTNSAND